MNYMGASMKINYENYVLPVIAQEKRQARKRLEKSTMTFYSSHFIPEEFEVPSFSLGSKKIVDIASIRSQIYQKPDSLTLLTYNVWFEGHNTPNRYPCILKLLNDSGADIICLQEVNQQFLSLIHSPPQSLPNLKEYCMPQMPMHWYDTLILSKYPCRFYKKSFESSGMGRCSLTAVIEMAKGQKKFVIGVNCVHLQSLNYPDERVNQLGQIEKLNQQMDLSIIAGDFNFGDGWVENKKIADYVDVWKRGKRHFSKYANEEMKDTGFTMPTNTRFPSWRPDHVIYKMKSTKQPEVDKNQIEIIGDFTIPPFQKQDFSFLSKDDCVRTPSDHFGLLSKICF